MRSAFRPVWCLILVNVPRLGEIRNITELLRHMKRMKVPPVLIVLFITSYLSFGHSTIAEEANHNGLTATQPARPHIVCGPFASTKDLPEPALQSDQHSVERFHAINNAVQQQTYSI